MATTKSAPKSEPKTKGTKAIDPKLKWLVGLAIVTAGLFIFLKSPSAEKLGINIEGMSSDASYGKQMQDVATSGKNIEFYGGPEVDCTSVTGCEDSRLKITSPSSESRLRTRTVHAIGWSFDESVEARYHQIAIYPIGCTDTSECPEPYIIADRYKGRSPYRWQIGAFFPVPQNLQNVPVWIRVTTQGLYRNGQPANYYTQTPVVLTMTR